jgi:hypothetical protein
MAPGRITVEAQWQSPWEIDLIIEVRDIGMAVPITSGSRDTGDGDMARKCGSLVITWCEDIDPAAVHAVVK